LAERWAADPPKLLRNGCGQFLAIVTTAEIDHSRIQVKTDRLGIAPIGTKNTMQEIGVFHLKGPREAGCPFENIDSTRMNKPVVNS
jgi:hypothetical protein